MKIGIIGAGHIGATAARLLVRAGHEVALSNSRGPESLRNLIEELGLKARALTVPETAGFGEIILLAVPWARPEALPDPEWVAGKVVIDAMNPYNPDGSILPLTNTTSTEEIAKRLPKARMVKAFNTIWYKHLAQNGDVSKPVPARQAIFLASDDLPAKQLVSELIESIGFAPVDTGSLAQGGRAQQPGTELYGKRLTGREAQQLVAALLGRLTR
jgi:predicted dinucleotide-binding enzyme